jgi:hypothetical protein
MRKLIVLQVLVLIAAGTFTTGTSAARENSCAVPAFSLVDWAEPPWTDEVMYVGVEGTSTPFVIQRGGDDCTLNPATVSYEVGPGTAGSSDLATRDGSVLMVGDGTHTAITQPISVSLTADSATEGVEYGWVTLTGTSYGRVVPPAAAKLYILDDDDSLEHVGFIAQEFSRNESSSSIQLAIFRWGNATQATTVDYTVTGGPGEAATPGSDIATGGVVHFAAGVRWTRFSVPLFDDAIAEPPEQATVTLSGTTVAEPDTATVTILDNEERFPPTSRFHHPRNDYVYASKDYRIREVHVFTDDVGSGVKRVEWALRRNMTSGRCRWWDGEGWRGGSCSSKNWLRMKKYEPDFFYATLRPLKPSVRSRIKNYTAFSKAVDLAGNWQQGFIVGRNANTFEVKRGS